jgi:lipopolysaccharide export LptBFGC system permease protein LptF
VDLKTYLIWFGTGIVGGVLAEFYTLYQHRKTPFKEIPEYYRSWFYWLMVFVMILIGGSIPVVYSYFGNNMNVFLAFHLGLSAPLIISRLVQSEPNSD